MVMLTFILFILYQSCKNFSLESAYSSTQHLTGEPGSLRQSLNVRPISLFLMQGLAQTMEGAVPICEGDHTIHDLVGQIMLGAELKQESLS